MDRLRPPLPGTALPNRVPTELPYVTLNEGFLLLFELASSDPIVRRCISILTDQVLGDCDINMKSNQATKPRLNAQFKKHLTCYYKPFLHEAVFAFLTYGFVPYVFKRVKNEIVPVILPLGSFRWTVVPNTFEQRICKNYDDAAAAQLLLYKVDVCTNIQLKATTDATPPRDVDIHIFNFLQPHDRVTERSLLHSTPVSPLSVLISQYKDLVDARTRRAYANAWNTTARVATIHTQTKPCDTQPTIESFKDNSRDQMLNGEDIREYHKSINELRSVAETDDENRQRAKIEQTFSQSSNHYPYVYGLPSNIEVQSLQQLQSIEDPELMAQSFQEQICLIFGVPSYYFGNIKTSSSQETTTSIVVTEQRHQFQRKVLTMRNELERLLSRVYEQVYGDSRELEIDPVNSVDVSIENVTEFIALTSTTRDVMQSSGSSTSTGTSGTQAASRKKRKADTLIDRCQEKLLESFLKRIK